MSPVHRESQPSRQRRNFRLSRDGILFFLGILGVGNETLFQNAERPTLLLLFGAMVGLPAFLRQDEKKIEPPPYEPPDPEPEPPAQKPKTGKHRSNDMEKT